MSTGINRIYKSESTQFTTVPNWVVRDPNYSPNAFRLLAYLLSHSDGYELTYGQIERQTTLGRYAINQAAKFLIEEGWLEWEQEKGANGQWLAKTWILKDPNSTVPLRNESTTESFHYGTVNGHIENNLLEKNTNKRNTLLEDAHLLFKEFWKEYPRKLDKGKAERAFKSALTRTSFEDIIAGVIRYTNDPNRNPEFTKYPASWLNADAWENPLLPYDPRLAKETEAQENKRKLDEYMKQQTEMGN